MSDVQFAGENPHHALGRYLDVTGFGEAMERECHLEFHPFRVRGFSLSEGSQLPSITKAQLPPMSLFAGPQQAASTPVAAYQWDVPFKPFKGDYTHHPEGDGPRPAYAEVWVACDYVEEKYHVQIRQVDIEGYSIFYDGLQLTELTRGASLYWEKRHRIHEWRHEVVMQLMDKDKAWVYHVPESLDSTLIHWHGLAIDLQDVAFRWLTDTTPSIEAVRDIARMMHPEKAEYL